MADVEFIDFSAEVIEGMESALIAGLEEAAGELEAMTIRNSRQSHKYGSIRATALWEHLVDEGEMKASVGSQHEAAYWEEFGTGSHALNGDGRKGWWVYVEGQDSGSGGKSYASKEEAEEAAEFLRRVAKLNAYATNGIEPNEPLRRAFASGKTVVQAIFEDKLKGLGNVQHDLVGFGILEGYNGQFLIHKTPRVLAKSYITLRCNGAAVGSHITLRRGNAHQHGTHCVHSIDSSLNGLGTQDTV